MPELIVMCGPAGSGKSTWAQEYVQTHAGYSIISTDAIREFLFGDASIQSQPRLVFNFAYSHIADSLKDGINVIFDAMNLRAKDRRAVIKRFKDIPNVRFICICCETPRKLCQERQKLRERKVSSEVITKQFERFQIPHKDEGWDSIICHHAYDHNILI